MGLDYRPPTVTAAQYADIFARERTQEYPTVDAFEARMGFSIERQRLESAAEILACPYKATAPNWQHGRVIYAAVRRYAATRGDERLVHVDIGTAKGFSALAAQWALDDAGVTYGTVHTVDVLPMRARLRRNTVAEVGGLQTLDEVIALVPDTDRFKLYEMSGIAFLRGTGRIHTAFIDGKHSTEAVAAEWRALASRQHTDDLAIFDDVQMPAVEAGLNGADKAYQLERLALDGVNRAYMIGVRL